MNRTERFSRPDLLTAASAETVPYLCLAVARIPHKNAGLDILNSALNSIV